MVVLVFLIKTELLTALWSDNGHNFSLLLIISLKTLALVRCNQVIAY
jgi:hypothetical protein